MAQGDRERFLTIYSDMPLEVRKEIVVVLEEEPITWNVAYLEIKNETERGEKILEKLVELDII